MMMQQEGGIIGDQQQKKAAAAPFGRSQGNPLDSFVGTVSQRPVYQ